MMPPWSSLGSLGIGGGNRSDKIRPHVGGEQWCAEVGRPYLGTSRKQGGQISPDPFAVSARVQRGCCVTWTKPLVLSCLSFPFSPRTD